MLFLILLSFYVQATVQNDRGLISYLLFRFRFHYASETLYNKKDFELLVNAGRGLDGVFMMKNISSHVI